MSTLAVNAFDFAFPSCEPSTPPNFSFDPSLLEIPFNAGHARSSSRGSVYSMVSTAESTPDTVSTRMTTPSSRNSPPVRSHGPLLLPKIRPQDQGLETSPPKRIKTSPAPAAMPRAAFRRSHHRSFTNPEPITYNHMAFAPVVPSIEEQQQQQSSSLLCSPVMLAQDQMSMSTARRASTCSSIDNGAVERYGYPTYRQMPSYMGASSATPEPFMFPSYAPRAPSPLSLAPAPPTNVMAATPDPTGPTTNLTTYLTAPNPAPSLVLNYRSTHSDPLIKHFWWDVRQVRPWSDFSASTILGLPGASALLACPVPAPVLPALPMPSRQPETEASLHSIFAHYYLPKLNAALAISSVRPITLAVPPKTVALGQSSNPELLFVGNAAGESATAAAMFGGKPTARMVGIVRTFNNFNTGMRTEDNVKKVEYLRGLAAVHHAMREHGCRYGFIMTEIELVLVRNGCERTPHFGCLEVATVPLAAASEDLDAESDEDDATVPLTACLALWGLAMLAGDQAQPGQPGWRAEIGAPAEGTRRKALPVDKWIPKPQLAEKRAAKRSRGWVMPEDPVGRKEMGKRGVRYGAC